MTWQRVLAYYEQDFVQSPSLHIIVYIKSYYMMNSDEWTLDPDGDFFPCCRVNANGSSIKQENPQLAVTAPLDRAKPCVQIDGQHANAISKSMSVNHVHGSHHTWAQWECSANMWRRVGGQYVQVWSSTNPFDTTVYIAAPSCTIQMDPNGRN